MRNETIGFNMEQADKTEQIRQQAMALDVNCNKASWQLRELVEASFMSRQAEVRRGAGKWIKGFFVDYGNANRKEGNKEINVTLPIDRKIPFDKGALADYMSFLGLWMSGVNFLKKEFGEEAVKEVGISFSRLGALYPEAAEVFKGAQTTVDRSASDKGGLKFRLLHLIDKNRNAAPSLHVEIAGFAYSRLTDLVDVYAKDSKDIYQPIKDVIFRKAVRILEAVLLVKQHAVVDVGLGLAALSAKESDFTPRRAHEMIEAMFRDNGYGMDEATILEIRQTIQRMYDEVMAEIAARPETPTPQILIEYLKRFE
jgi:hypothetical protein